MKVYAPHYYREFSCIADRCRHSCCIGWEIDIDGDTLEMYDSLPGELGERIRDGIDREGEPHFKLCHGDRCHFLTDSGLCSIILTLGEEGLSDICAEHPRFRSYFSDRVEIGLGLCCEEVCRLVLEDESPFSTVLLEDDGEGDEPLSAEEEEFFRVREEIFALACDRTRPIGDRFRSVGERYADIPSVTPSEWAELYRSLERLYPEWDSYLQLLWGEERLSVPEETAVQAEQLFAYFLYRHGGRDTKSLRRAAGFALHGAELILTLHKASGEEPAQVCRLYSSEIEYSDCNTEAVLSLFGEYDG